MSVEKVFPIYRLRFRRLAVLGAVGLLVFCSEQAEAGRSKLPAHFKMRLGGAYGEMDYTGKNRTSSSRFSFEGFQQPGVFIDTELWFRGRIGFLSTIEEHYAGVFGKSVFFVHTHGALAWRLISDGKPMGKEVAIYAGGSLQEIPDIQTFTATKIIDLAQPRVLGIIGGIRVRFPLHKNWSVEAGGAYVSPLKVMTSPKPELDKTESRTQLVDVNVDYRYYEGMSIGFGYRYRTTTLNYTPTVRNAAQVQVIDLKVSSATLSVRFWF